LSTDFAQALFLTLIARPNLCKVIPRGLGEAATISQGTKTMEKEAHCKCTTSCQNRRCLCLRNNEPCGPDCNCTDCQNPLNDVDVKTLSVCAIRNIPAYKALSEEKLAELHLALPDM
jgi:hypothetical protein